MMKLTVRLFGGLERFASMQRRLEIQMEDGATLAAVQDLLGIPRGEVSLFLVNHQIRSEGDLAQDGSTVDLYPMFGGG